MSYVKIKQATLMSVMNPIDVRNNMNSRIPNYTFRHVVQEAKEVLFKLCITTSRTVMELVLLKHNNNRVLKCVCQVPPRFPFKNNLNTFS